MTSTSTNSRTKPFLLTPAGKDYLWGGNRLKTEFNKEIDLVPVRFSSVSISTQMLLGNCSRRIVRTLVMIDMEKPPHQKD